MSFSEALDDIAPKPISTPEDLINAIKDPDFYRGVSSQIYTLYAGYTDLAHELMVLLDRLAPAVDPQFPKETVDIESNRGLIDDLIQLAQTQRSVDDRIAKYRKLSSEKATTNSALEAPQVQAPIPAAPPEKITPKFEKPEDLMFTMRGEYIQARLAEGEAGVKALVDEVKTGVIQYEGAKKVRSLQSGLKLVEMYGPDGADAIYEYLKNKFNSGINCLICSI